MSRTKLAVALVTALGSLFFFFRASTALGQAMGLTETQGMVGAVVVALILGAAVGYGVKDPAATKPSAPPSAG